MQKLTDKLVLFGMCLLALSFSELGWRSVMAMLLAVAVSSLSGYLENKVSAGLCVGYIGACLFVPAFIPFMPLIVYDSAGLRWRPLRFVWAAALTVCFFAVPPQVSLIIALASGAAFLLHVRTAAQLKARAELFAALDSAKERTALLELKNRELMEKQDYEVRLATLSERNRIAREIHDNVGHLLTRSLLQIGALRVTRAGDGGLANELDWVKGTLSDAMDSIRSSVHDLHGESFDLKDRLETMASGFTFCPVKLSYDAGDLPAEVKYCFTAIVREALSNIARHSDASGASVTVTEHPAFCRLLIADNGTVKPDKGPKGIGLQNMADRVESLGGIFRAEYDKGFRIFISVPKGGVL
ncbi:MAG: histidine kinase [Oscillospiraceae bacterium]|nr:histidine kinase [Oscillospiraceae bacterium]